MGKIRVTPQQRANARFARDVMWPSIPPENVAPKLGFWAKRLNGRRLVPHIAHPVRIATCGTIACFGGWVAQNPYFQAQGVRPSDDGLPMMTTGTATHYGSGVAFMLFGDAFLFEYANDPGPAHQIVTERLDELIKGSVIDRGAR